ncbi:MAG: hypothetical protein OM95_06205 [Bdellovibrio sp. ArHS]|nr:MAG: hypothetical protein OM95_06205 [Bdellovibrio sp. ArHS]
MFGWAHAETNCYLINECSRFRRDPVSPSPGTQIKINPSAVPTEKGYGIEAIYFSQEADLSLVRGTGRMGAALSPSNSEDTFFGAPGIETPAELFKRKDEKLKYPNQKITLAAAFNLFERKGNGLKKYNLKLGLMGKYNKLSANISPGGGLSGAIGPLAFGYSYYEDQTQWDSSFFGGSTKELTKYQVQTYNLGLYLNAVILNYSNLRLKIEDDLSETQIHLYTVSVSMGKFIFTAAKRDEDSSTQAYNYETHTLEEKKIKEEYFGGIQYTLTRNLMVGGLYNYYLLREGSITATLFF